MLDRLPRTNSIEGLKVLVCAWDEYDITMHLADSYKFFARVLYMLLLFVGILIAVCGVMYQQLKSEGGSKERMPVLRSLLFGLPLCSSFLLSVWGYTNPTSRWRKLRNSACALESLIWKFRTRTPPFSNANVPNHSESRFCAALNAWRDECVAGTDLLATALEKKYHAGVFKHYQHEEAGDFPEDVKDDFHSPLKPEKYIVLRLMRQYEFYQERVPRYSRRKDFLQTLSVLLSACGSILVFFDASQYVVIVSSVAGAATSWSEFRDVSRKLERYTTTIRSIRKLKSFWDSLDKVDKNSTARITQLVGSGETIITSETGSWNSTAASDESTRMASEGGDEETGGKAEASSSATSKADGK
jgi:hypothetical protein